MNNTEETTIVINGVTLSPDQVQSLMAASQCYKFKLMGYRFSEDVTSRALSDAFLSDICSVEALLNQSVHEDHV
ncbi:hypothetical protein [Pantoea sp. GbtcB22]|uniref:hypothetical protein n=1 Tax=Pantoea sp. GbtcB22 TaxID=2824767 RepID=UPI001C30C6ED|nr:hypothetical protein [Pantoea sp. GbtcB22]